MALSRTKNDYLDAFDDPDLPHDRRAALRLMIEIHGIIAEGGEPPPVRDISAEVSKQSETLQCANL